jgi:hypothetical protein
MAADDPSPNPPPKSRPPLRSARRSAPGPPPNNSNRILFRLIAIPALAFAGVLIYRGVQERFTLPECDSSRAKSTLSDVLNQLKVEPLRDEPIKTISSSKQQVVCNVVLPLADGGTLNIDYTFFWQGNTADMHYSISRKPAQKSETKAPQESSLRGAERRSNPESLAENWIASLRSQ